MEAAKGKSPSENAEMVGMTGPQTGDKDPKLKQEPGQSFCVHCSAFLFSPSSLFPFEENAQCLERRLWSTITLGWTQTTEV